MKMENPKWDDQTYLLNPSQPNEYTQSKLRSKTIMAHKFLLPALFGIALLHTRYNAAGAGLLLITPTIWLWHHVSSYAPSERPHRKTLIYTYILTGTLGMAVVAAIQLIIVCSVGWLLLGSDLETYILEAMKPQDKITNPDEIAYRYEMSRRWQYWVLLFTFAFDAAALLEEGLKYCVIVLARRWGRVEQPRDVVFVAIAASFGFATVENIGFVYSAWKENSSGPTVALMVFERLVFGLPGHTLMTLITATGMIEHAFKNDVRTVARVLKLPILIHGSFDFLCLAVSAYDGNVGWVHPKKGPSLYFLLAVAITFSVGQTVFVSKRLRGIGGVF